MQCPNCRNVEKGQWLFANGSTRLFPEFVMEDWIPEEDLYALSYPEMVNFVQPYMFSFPVHENCAFIIQPPYFYQLYEILICILI